MYMWIYNALLFYTCMYLSQYACTYMYMYILMIWTRHALLLETHYHNKYWLQRPPMDPEGLNREVIFYLKGDLSYYCNY